MKPDGVAATPAEPADNVVESVPEAAANGEQVQQDPSPLSPQLEKPEHEGMQEEGATSTLPLSGREVNGKFSTSKDKTTAPVKTKPRTAGVKATATTGAAPRPATATSRVANGVMKIPSNGASKKPVSKTSEVKKSATVKVAPQVKKVPTATAIAPRPQVKTAERKAVGSAKPVPSTSGGIRKTAAAPTSQALSTKPVAGASNAAVKPKTTGTVQQKLVRTISVLFQFIFKVLLGPTIYLFCSTKAYFCTCCQSQWFSCFQSCSDFQNNPVSPPVMC